MPGVRLDKVADETTDRNLRALNDALAATQADPMRFARKGYARVRAVVLKEPVSESAQLLAPTKLAFVVERPGVYLFRFVVFFQTAATTTGLGLAVAGPDASLVRYGICISQSDTAIFNSAQTAYGGTTVSASIAASNTTKHAVVDGSVFVKSPGNLVLQFRTEVSTSAVLIQAGSFGTLTEAE